MSCWLAAERVASVAAERTASLVAVAYATEKGDRPWAAASRSKTQSGISETTGTRPCSTGVLRW